MRETRQPKIANRDLAIGERLVQQGRGDLGEAMEDEGKECEEEAVEKLWEAAYSL